MTALPNPTALPGVVRAGNWWHSKLPPLLSVVYAAGLVFGLGATSVAELWLAALVSILGIASYGHVVNDAFDIEVDRLAGKPNAMAGFTVVQRTAVALILLAVSFAPAALVPYGLAATALVAVNCLLPTLYSVPPVRIKERGIWALLFDAGGAHVVPTLWISLVALRLFNGDHRLGWVFTVVMTLWALTVGIKGILRHQIFDLAADEQAGIATFSRRGNLARVAAFLEHRWYLAEVAMFAAVVVLLTPAAPLLPVALVAYLPLEFKKQNLGWRFKFDARDPVSQRHRPLVNNYFYELALPVVLLVHLAWSQPWLAWLLPAHLALFWKNVYVQWADLRRLLQNAHDVRAGRESLHRYRGSFEQTEHARGILRVRASNPAHFELRVTATDGEMDHLRFCHGPWKIVQGQAYAVLFRARSHALRQATVGLRQQCEPWAGLGLDVPFVMDARLRTFEATFTATASDDQAVFFITLGDAVGPVDVEGVELSPLPANPWALMCERPFVAQCVVPDTKMGHRIELLDATDCPDAVRFLQLGVRLRRGAVYRMLFAVRADRTRPISAGVCRHGKDWRGLGLAEVFQVDAAWRTLAADFFAESDEPDACAYLWLGGAGGLVDVGQISVVEISAADARQVVCHTGARAQLVQSVEGGALRLELPTPGDLADHVRLSWPAPQLERGEYYTATLELRADRPRQVGYGVSEATEPFAGLGLCGALELDTDWQRQTFDFRTLADDAAPSLYLLAGGDSAAIEIRRAEVGASAQRHPLSLQLATGLESLAHQARLPLDESLPARVTLEELTQHVDDATLCVERFSVAAERDYELTFRARSAYPRKVGVGMCEADEPWENLGLSAQVQLTSHWRTYVLPFRAAASARFARVCYWLGCSQHEFEVQNTQLHVVPTGGLPWEIRHTSDCSAQCIEQGVYRVELLECGSLPTNVQVVFRVGPVRKGQRYRAKLLLQADARRSISLTLSQRGEPWRSLGNDVTVELDATPHTMFVDFLAEADEADAGLYLHLGGDPAAVAFSGVEFVELEGASPWRIDFSQGGQAIATPTSLDDRTVRVEIAALGPLSDDVKLVYMGLEVTQGRWYGVRFRARSDVPRRIACCLRQDHEPWESLGLYREFEITSDWQTYLGGFTPSASDDQATLSWILGENRHAVEIADVQVQPDETLLPLDLAVNEGSQAMLVAGEAAESLRCVPLATLGKPSDIWLTRPQVAIAAGQRYRLQLQARSDVPCGCAVGITQSVEPWSGLGLYTRLSLGPEWRAFGPEFTATGTDPAANLCVWLGGSLAPLEIQEIRLVRIGQPAEPVTAAATENRQ